MGAGLVWNNLKAWLAARNITTKTVAAFGLGLPVLFRTNPGFHVWVMSLYHALPSWLETAIVSGVIPVVIFYHGLSEKGEAQVADKVNHMRAMKAMAAKPIPYK